MKEVLFLFLNTRLYVQSHNVDTRYSNHLCTLIRVIVYYSNGINTIKPIVERFFFLNFMQLFRGG